MTNKKTLGQKLAEARTIVNVEKTGTNAFAKYKFYQIDEIYSEAKRVFRDLGLVTTVNTDIMLIGEKIYKKFSMDIIDTEDSNKLTYSVITEPNSMKGAQSAQEAGADITYMTKYLYGLALMLDDGASDPDMLNQHDTSTPTPKKSLSRAEKIEKANSMPKAERDKFIKEYSEESEMKIPENPTYWKNEVLDSLAKKMGWLA